MKTRKNPAKSTGKKRSVRNYKDTALLLSLDRVIEASREFDDYYEIKYDEALEYALECTEKHEKDVRTIQRLNCTIKEQEAVIDRLERDIRQFVNEFQGAQDDFTRGQVIVLRYCLEMIDSNYKGMGEKNE